MNLLKNIVTSFCVVMMLCVVCKDVFASDVQVRLSSKEAYVGSPLVLQISIIDGENDKTPTLPKVDGLEIESAGAPSQSTKIMIINGRHSETRTMTYSFLITAQKEGTYRIPAFEIDTGDQVHPIDPINFVVSKSETGDLLFVEVEGEKETAYVGESVDLSLKIWIKPFTDRERRVKLTEGDMWNCLSQGTQWGPFSERMAELAARGQRPGGEEVLRKDADGVERSYYLYQVDAPIYPKRAGQLDMDDVRIVVDYPTELGVSRGALGNRLQRPGAFDLFDDDFFNAFSDRLVISDRRPIVGEAMVGNTQILPIPSEGQPAGYQGAVGEYDIVVKAANTEVSVGEPIALQIDIQGTGPMDLVQAPRLEEVDSLKKDFRVPTQTLAGTTMGPVKYFDTTIRPLNENVKQIPPIPFSFFDPALKQFKTVYSQPIPITVHPSETLAIDSIVGQKQPESQAPSQDRSVVIDPLKNWNWDTWKTTPDFNNSYSATMLQSETRPQSSFSRWWLFAPPIVWLLGWLLQWRGAPALAWNAFRSSDKKFAAALSASLRSPSPGEPTAQALAQYICELCRNRMPDGPPSNSTASITQAVGSLRLLGLYGLAAKVESYLNRCQTSHNMDEAKSLHSEALTLAEEVKQELKSCRPKNVTARTSVAKLARTSGMLFSGILFFTSISAATLTMPRSVFAVESTATPNDTTSVSAELSETLKEATQIYQAATPKDPNPDAAISDAAVEADRDAFQLAAEKYQYVIDSGVQNHQLFFNAANAYAKAGMPGRAIFNYRKGLQLRPGDAQILANLQQVQSSVSGQPKEQLNQWKQLAQWLPDYWWNRMMLASWIGFWGLLILRQWGTTTHWLVPATLLSLTVFSALFSGSDWLNPKPLSTAIVISDQISGRDSDGESFPVIAERTNTNGWQLPVIAERGEWVQVELSPTQTAWLPKTDVLVLD